MSARPWCDTPRARTYTWNFLKLPRKNVFGEIRKIHMSVPQAHREHGILTSNFIILIWEGHFGHYLTPPKTINEYKGSFISIPVQRISSN